MANPVEMAHSLEGVVKRLQADPKYPELFKRAWGTDQITIDMVVKSIASFERTVIAGDSPFDRFYYGHDSKALPSPAQRGLIIFISAKKGNCAVCHPIGKDYALFTDNKFHNLGVGADTRGNLNDLGRYKETKNEADMGAFKTPSLRNLANRGPYMHDGTFPTVKDALAHYIGGGNWNPHLDKEIHSLDVLTFDERDDLLQFLDSLNGKLPDNIGPPPDLAPPAKPAPSPSNFGVRRLAAAFTPSCAAAHIPAQFPRPLCKPFSSPSVVHYPLHHLPQGASPHVRWNSSSRRRPHPHRRRCALVVGRPTLQ